MSNHDKAVSLATLGNGCFWCTEAVFQLLPGVEHVRPGYCGGKTANPTYQEICTGTTGHAEVIQIKFRPEEISYTALLEVFWKTHDPTTLNRQGADVGTQYRSVVFYHDEQQQAEATRYKQQLDESGIFAAPIVTEITEMQMFYPAEAYHQDYFRQHGDQGYCRAVIRPKLEKFSQEFENRLKTP